VSDIYYVRPDENRLYGATVSTTAGATDADYLDEWLCDGRLGRPVRATSGTATWSATFSSGEVGLVAVCGTNSDVNATIGGTVTGTVTAGTLQPNGIRLNGFLAPTPATGTTLTVAFSGAASTLVVGEVIAGKRRSLTRPVYSSDDTEVYDNAPVRPMDQSFLPPYDDGMVQRIWSCGFIVSTAERDNILDWYLAQRGETRPSLVVPDPSINDAWLCFLQKPSFKPVTGRHWSVTLKIIEVPRVRW
jgi:hypothetical protein